LASHRGGDADIPPTITVPRLIFVGTGFAALILGYIGFGQLLRGSTTYGNRPLDLLYYDLQLFVLGSDPLQQGVPLPLLVQIARFAAPAVTIYAFAEAFRLVFDVELRRLRARRARGHVIVCGETMVAQTLVRRLRAAGRLVVEVRSGAAPPEVRPARGLTVIGDARDPEVLSAAGVRRAGVLYACTGDSAVNSAIALAAGLRRSESAGTLAVHANIRDPDLCLTLQARYLGLPHPAGLRLDFFNIDDLAARRLLTDLPVEPVPSAAGTRPPQVLVVGATRFGQAVIVEACRRWRVDQPDGGRLPVTVVDLEASPVIEQLSRRYPFLRAVCEFTAYHGDLLPALAGRRLRDAPDIALVCYDDEELALKTAMTAERFWQGSRVIVVRLDHLATFQGRRNPHGEDQFFGESGGKLRVFGVINAGADPELIRKDLIDRLARVIHDRYRIARHRERESSLAGPTANNHRSLVDWDLLPADLQCSNREQARDIGRKLRRIGCVLVPRVGDDGPGVLGAAEVDQLARMEHERWRTEYEALGWQYGAQHDAARKLHPGLLDWAALPDPLRRRNQDAMVELPAILADAGFQIVRL
jgi:voltage-gated potassium channel Kch